MTFRDIPMNNCYICISDPVEDGVPSQGGQNSDMNDEPASNAGYIVIVVIIIVLILVALVVFGLHYKRKLPESFYNLGGLVKGDKQWKPVLSKVCYDIVQAFNPEFKSTLT